MKKLKLIMIVVVVLALSVLMLGSLAWKEGSITKADILMNSGVPGKGLGNAPGLDKPFNPDSQAGEGTDWWYVDASYGGYHNSVPLVIELDGDSTSGQTFNVGDTVDITVDYHAYAVSCGGDGNEAETEWNLVVAGPSGPDFVYGWNYDCNSGCAEVDTVATLTIVYTLTAPGTHTISMSSYAAVSQYWTEVAEDWADASLTFEVVVPIVPINAGMK